MSLNTAHANGGVLIYSGERILVYYDGVEMAFEMQDNQPLFKGHKKGRVYLTTHRVIFNNSNIKDTFQSFSMPFYSMKDVELEQPVFGANYIKGTVAADRNGNFVGTGKWKMWFNNGGAIDFGQAMLHAGRLASRYFPTQPPPYVTPQGGYYQAPPPAYTAPQAPLYGFIPYQTFPSAPPSDGVYSSYAPPPYPGIDPNLNAYQPPTNDNRNVNASSAAAAKEAEAMANGGNAYYTTENPHTIYMPQQPPYPQQPSYPSNPGDAPPPYSESHKNK